MKLLLSNLIPKEFRQDKSIFASARLIVQIDLMIILSALLLFPIFLYIGFIQGCCITIFSLVNAIIFIFLMRFKKNLVLCGNFFTICSLIVFAWMALATGGIESPFIIWLLTIPPIAYFYMHKNSATTWTIITIVTVCLIGLSTIMGLYIPGQLASGLGPYFFLINFVLVLSLFLVVVMSFKRSYKQMNFRLANTNTKLLETNEELERFAYIASHDLKSPLRNVLSFLKLFKRKHQASISEEGQEYLDIVSNNAQHMYHLIEDILEFSKTKSQKLKEKPVNLNELMAHIANQLIPDFPNANKIRIITDELPIILADSTRMLQLFQNLIENGIKYNEAIIPQVNIKHRVVGDYHRFEIIDNGIGIEPQFRDKIFEMFRRLHNQERYEGTGIGLAICKRIVRQYQGGFEIYTNPKGGTIFSFTLLRSKVRLAPELRLDWANQLN